MLQSGYTWFLGDTRVMASLSRFQGKVSGRGALFFAAVLLTLVVVLPRASLAEEAAPAFTVPPVPSFTPNQISNLSSVLSQCSGQSFATSVRGLAACALAGDDVDVELELSCDFMGPGFVIAQSAKITQAVTGQQCKKARIAEARGKLDCLQRGASLMESMIGQQRQRFEQEIQAAQSALRQLDQIKKGFEEQNKTIGERLNGNSDSGAKGLIQATEEMQAALDQMQGPQGVIELFKQKNREIDDRRKFLLEQVQARTLELTTSCIAEGGTQGKRYQCEPNGPDVDYFTYLGCLYRASFYLGEGGRIERNAVADKKAAAGVQSLGGALQRLLASVPRSIGAPPSSPQRLDQLTSNTSQLWFGFDDFKDEIRRRLSGFENKNFRVADRVLRKAEGCFNTAKVQVSRERRGASSGGSRLVDLQLEIKRSEEEQSANAKKFFFEANRSYVDAVKPLLGRNVPLQLDQCTTAKPRIQGECMNQVQSSFEDLYLGKSDLTKLNMVVPGNGAVRDLVIQCAGLKGCTADLQAQHDYLKSTITQVDQAKTKYANEANQKIDAMRTSLARAMAFPNQLVIQQQDELNRFLSELGVGSSVELEDVEGRAFEKDDDEALSGLYKNPEGEDFLAAIGAGSTPPLKKVGKDSFKDAYQGMADAEKEANEKIAKLNSLKSKMLAASAKCAAEAMEKALGGIERDLDRLEDCRHVSGWCDDDGDALQDLLSSLEDISGSGAEGAIAMLNNGIEACTSSKLKGGENINQQQACETQYERTIRHVKRKVGSLERGGGGAATSAMGF